MYNIIIIEYKKENCFVRDFFNDKSGELNTNKVLRYCQKYSQCIFLILCSEDNPNDLIDCMEKNHLYVLKYTPQIKEENLSNPNTSEILSSLKRIEDSLKSGNTNKNPSFISSLINSVREGAESEERCSPNLEEFDKKLSSLSVKLCSIERTINDLHDQSSKQKGTTNPKFDDQQYLNSHYKEALESFSKKMSSIEFLVSELYNQLPNQADPAQSVIDDLRNELSSYKNDFYLKSMQKYGVDIAIKMISRLYSEKQDIEQNFPEDEGLRERFKKLIDFCQAEFSKLNLEFVRSVSGDQFDGEKMTSYDDYVDSSEPSLSGCVAYSISPAVIWTLPIVNSESNHKIVLKEEIVALYK